MKWNFLSKPKNILFMTIFLSLIPFLTVVTKVWLGEFAFWYDPARDLLSAIDNMSKPTLIGPTSGIPGVFYGPYWIWFLSIGTLLSHDPRIVTFVVLTLPYFVLFPFILSRFSSVISPIVLALLWLLFLLGFNTYFSDLWNPHLAPLLVLLVILLLFSLSHRWTLKNILISLSAGFSMGIVMNFQLSFGIGMFLGVLLYFIGDNLFYFLGKRKKEISFFKTILLVLLFFFGCITAFAPFLLFEVRHQFIQTKTLLNAFVHYGGVVNLHGLSQHEILLAFLGRMASLIHIPLVVAGIVLIVLCVAYLISNRYQLKENETKLLTLTFCIAFGVLLIYLTAKNPIWEYHFIGVEILWLLFLGILLNRSMLLRKLFAIWIIILVGLSAFSFFPRFGQAHEIIAGTLISKQKVVEKIANESGNQPYTVFVYNPAIYTYDYSYLFNWMLKKDVPYRPELIPTDSQTVFVLIPPQTSEIKAIDFIHFRTPDKEYQTKTQWVLSDGTKILKREKFSSK